MTFKVTPDMISAGVAASYSFLIHPAREVTAIYTAMELARLSGEAQERDAATRRREMNTDWPDPHRIKVI